MTLWHRLKKIIRPVAKYILYRSVLRRLLMNFWMNGALSVYGRFIRNIIFTSPPRFGWKVGKTHGLMLDIPYALTILPGHFVNGRLTTEQVAGLTLLELGPGDSLINAVYAAAYGAKIYLVDVGDFAINDVGFYHRAAAAMTERGLKPPNIANASNLNDVLKQSQATYLTNGLESLRTLPSASVDFIFSHVVLEHVKADQFLPTMQECYRILKPGGVCSHCVDFRDHMEYRVQNDSRMNHLRFKTSIWEMAFRHNDLPWVYTNRILCSEMVELCKKAGFSQLDILYTEKYTKLPNYRHRLAQPFRQYPDDELLISGAGYFTQKPKN